MRPAMYDLRIVPTLTLTSADVQAFTDADFEELRDLGTTDAMFGRL